jgi:hypothetical protein
MTPVVRDSRPSLPMCCLSAAAHGRPCPVCVRPSLPPPPPRGAPVVARVACEACATLAAELGRDVGCLRHPRETATPDTSGAQSVVDGVMGEGSEGR